MSFPAEQGPRPEPSGLFFNVIETRWFTSYRHIDEHGRRSTVLLDNSSGNWSRHFDEGGSRASTNGTLLAISTDGACSVRKPDGLEATTYADGSSLIVDPDGRTIRRTTENEIIVVGYSEALGKMAVAHGFIDTDGIVHRTSLEALDDIGNELLNGGNDPLQ